MPVKRWPLQGVQVSSRSKTMILNDQVELLYNYKILTTSAMEQKYCVRNTAIFPWTSCTLFQKCLRCTDEWLIDHE